jgi:hypothetical protein
MVRRTLLIVAVLFLAVGAARAQTAATQPAAEKTTTAPAPKDVAAVPATGDPFEDALQRAKKPFPWLSFEADQRSRIEYTNDASLNEDGPNREKTLHRYRERFGTKFRPLPSYEDLDVNVRLVYEPRFMVQPENVDPVAFDEAIFDKLNFQWRNALGIKNETLTGGRQDLTDLGNGWLTQDGTPLDGSRTYFFDAIRSTYKMPDIKTDVDVIYIEQSHQSDQYIDPFCDKDLPLTEQDETGFILWVTNKSIAKTEIDGFFIYKNDHKVTDDPLIKPSKSNESDLYTFGPRVVHEFNDNWATRAELAEQLGHQNGQDQCATGFNSRTTYSFRDPYCNQLMFDYEYLSGDRPGTDKNEAFDPLWGRWPQWSELWLSVEAPETRTAQVNNLHRLGPGWAVKPVKDMTYCFNYYFLFTDQNTFASTPGFTSDGPFRGQLLTSLLTYQFTKHMAGHLQQEVFVPGNYYDSSKNDVALFLRAQLEFKW